MFTGLIEEVAYVESVKKKGKIHLICVETKGFDKQVKKGDSIAVNGVCLTVVMCENNTICFEVMGKTFKNTNLCFLKRADAVNIERALSFGDRIGGHFVQGHVDCVVDIKNIQDDLNGLKFSLGLSRENTPFIVTKGSVALDGVSLTVQDVRRDNFDVYLIPHTLKETNFKKRKIGDKLNLEIDILAKYTKFRNAQPSLTADFLKKSGF